MLSEFPIFQRFKIEEIYKDLASKNKELIENYIKYRQARGLNSKEKLADTRRRIIQLIFILGKDYENLSLPIKKENKPLNILRELLVLINKSYLTNNVKNDFKTDLKNFLRYNFSDWSLRFSNLEDIKIKTITNEEKINPKNLIQKEEVEKLVQHETKMYWKAFILCQYEAGLRTKEARFLKWTDINFSVDGDISEVNIYSTKTKKARTIFVKEATFYLKKLKEEQENTETKGVYIFHSKRDLNEPVDKFTVSFWFRNLTQKTLGRKGWNYLLRHSRATELYRLARDNKMARDTAQEFMGHSKDMSYIYEHLDKNKIKEMLKNQVYKIEELPEKEKNELQKELEEQKREFVKSEDEKKVMQEKIQTMENQMKKIAEMTDLLSESSKKLKDYDLVPKNKKK